MSQRLGDAEHPELDQPWDSQARGETELQRLDRNWSDLLQELRVVQTGVQLLTGFLLTLPFQSRFARLNHTQENVYLATVACSILATGLLISPVVLHRMVFRQHARRATVSAAHWLALAGTCFLACAILGVAWLIFAVVRGTAAGLVAAGAVAALLLGLWLGLPLTVRILNHRATGPPAGRTR
jgi:hypothetical protein